MLADCIFLEKMEEGLIAIENCVELAVRGLEVHVHGSEERLIQAARWHGRSKCFEESKEREEIARLAG